MKNIIVSAALAFGVMASVQVSAAQDQLQQQMQRQQAVQNAARASEKNQDEGGSPSDAAKPKTTVLPLDHGPHGQVTPWVNEQRRKAQQNDAG